MAIIMVIKEITSTEISIMGVTIGHSMEMQVKILVTRKTGSSRLQREKLDREPNPQEVILRSLWEKEEGYFIYAKFDKCFISMLVDTGASVSILSKKQFDS